MQEISKLLREKGLKVTPQRLAIYNMLMNTDKHPSAETIYKELVVDNPSISLATVYKTLDSFTSAELIQELSIDGESLHYDYNTAFHPHIICKKCGSVCDIDLDISDEINSVINKIGSNTKYKVDKEQLFFYGLCENCEE